MVNHRAQFFQECSVSLIHKSSCSHPLFTGYCIYSRRPLAAADLADSADLADLTDATDLADSADSTDLADSVDLVDPYFNPHLNRLDYF